MPAKLRYRLREFRLLFRPSVSRWRAFTLSFKITNVLLYSGKHLTSTDALPPELALAFNAKLEFDGSTSAYTSFLSKFFKIKADFPLDCRMFALGISTL